MRVYFLRLHPADGIRIWRRIFADQPKIYNGAAHILNTELNACRKAFEIVFRRWIEERETINMCFITAKPNCCTQLQCIFCVYIWVKVKRASVIVYIYMYMCLAYNKECVKLEWKNTNLDFSHSSECKQKWRRGEKWPWWITTYKLTTLT